jgi:hypothetical protein
VAGRGRRDRGLERPAAPAALDSVHSISMDDSKVGRIRRRGGAFAWDEALASGDVRPLLALIAELEREARRDDLSWPLRQRAAAGLQRMNDVLEAVRNGNRQLVDELINGTVRENGTKRPDGLRQILPYWARGTDILDALRGIVVVDESEHPVTVTVHWERVPAKLRPAAASLASELVDSYRDRPRGGRQRKNRESRSGN